MLYMCMYVHIYVHINIRRLKKSLTYRWRALQRPIAWNRPWSSGESVRSFSPAWALQRHARDFNVWRSWPQLNNSWKTQRLQQWKKRKQSFFFFFFFAINYSILSQSSESTFVYICMFFCTVDIATWLQGSHVMSLGARYLTRYRSGARLQIVAKVSGT